MYHLPHLFGTSGDVQCVELATVSLQGWIDI